MRFRRGAIATAVACASAFMFTGVAAQASPATPAGIGLGPGSTLWLQGSSNLHEFEARTTAVTVKLTGDPAQHAPSTPAEIESYLRASGVRGLEVDVPTTSLHSGKTGLDKNMWKDLRADQYPAIQFHLTHYTVTPHEGSGDTLVARVEGALRIAGKECPVALSVKGHRGDGGLWFEGSHALRMTDFGIKPRTMMLGTLRVRDDVTVHFRLLLVPAVSAAPLSEGSR